MKKTVKILLVMMIAMIALTITVNAASGVDPSGYTLYRCSLSGESCQPTIRTSSGKIVS